MSATTLPEYIDAQKWADREATVNQHYPLAVFTRLCESATHNTGDVHINVRMYRDTQNLIVLEGQLSSKVSLTCQRCLEPVATDIQADVQLWLMRDELAAEQLPDEADFLLQDSEGRVALADVLEDELILALPLVAAHESCEHFPVENAENNAVVETPKRENPFQVLAGLKANPEDK